MNNCVPITKHYFCNDCKSYFKRTMSDCITLFPCQRGCIYCGSESLTVVEENTCRETLSCMKNKIRKVLRSKHHINQRE